MNFDLEISRIDCTVDKTYTYLVFLLSFSQDVKLSYWLLQFYHHITVVNHFLLFDFPNVVSYQSVVYL